MRILFFFICFCSSCLLCFGQNEKTVGDQLLELSGQTAKQANEINNVVKKLSDDIQSAISEATNLSELCAKFPKNMTLSDNDKLELKSRLEKIHRVYDEIVKNEDQYKEALYKSYDASKKIIQGSKTLSQEQKDRVSEVEREIRLIESKSNKSDDDLRIIRKLTTKKRLIAVIVTVVENFSNQVKKFDTVQSDVQKRVSDFLVGIHDAEEITELMLEVIDLVIRADEITENLETLLSLDKYTEEINKSLVDLSKALEELIKTAESNKTLKGTIERR